MQAGEQIIQLGIPRGHAFDAAVVFEQLLDLFEGADPVSYTHLKTVNIEGQTMVDMARKEILPAVEAYARDLADTCTVKQTAAPGVSGRYEKKTIAKLSTLADEIDEATDALESALIKYKTVSDVTEAACMIRDVILQKMAELRVVCDEAETVTSEKYWPFPTYGELLFGVK